MEIEAIHNATKASQSGLKSFEDAVSDEVRSLKGNPSITTETLNKAVLESSPSRHDDSTTAVMLNEIRNLKEEIRQRDSLFVEVLEKMQEKLDRIEEHQQQLNAPTTEPPKLNVSQSQPQQPKKSFWARIWKK